MTSESPNEPAATRRSRRATSAPQSRTPVPAGSEVSVEIPERVPVLERPAETPAVEPAAAAPSVEAPRPLTRRQLRRAAGSSVAPEAPRDSIALAEAEALTPPSPVVADDALAPEPAAEDALWARAPHESGLPPVGQPVADAKHTVDAFEAAARLFSFTGEVPTVASDEASPSDAARETADTVVRGSKRRRLSLRRVAAASFSVGVLGIVGLLAVGMTMAPQAVAAAAGSAASAATANLTLAGDVLPGDDEIQAYVAPSTVQSTALDRSDYSTGTIAETAASLGITQPSDFYVNNPNAPIQWPFAVGVSISYGFGWRYGGGEFHEGADFTPGEGAHVQAIADGTVRIATEDGGAYGVTVVLDHQIDGQLISTRYAHMLRGSLQVKVGDTVKVGQYLGRTGNTGRSFGAHTHVEVLLNGTTPIDPIAWLREHAG